MKFKDIRKELAEDEAFQKLVQEHYSEEVEKVKKEKDLKKIYGEKASWFLRLELLLWIVDELNVPNVPLREANKLFQLNHYELLQKATTISPEMDRALRIVAIRNPVSPIPYSWDVKLQKYFKFNRSFGLFFENEEGQLVRFDKPELYARRISGFEDWLKSHESKANRPLKTAFEPFFSEQLTCKQYSPQTKEVTTTQYLPRYDLLDPDDHNLFQLSNYEPKQELVIPADFDTDQMLASLKRDYPLPRIKLTNLKAPGEAIPMKGVVHVLGGLGVGKSNFKYGITKYFLEKQQAKRIVIVEDKVSTVLDIVKNLRELGIPAIPLFGKDDFKYLTEYLQTLTLEEIEEDETLQYLTGSCLAKTHISVLDTSEFEDREIPCNAMFSTDVDGYLHRVTCPYLSKCGQMRRFREMESSPVWVTTVSFFLRGSIPKVFNRNERSFMEIVYDTADLVIMDEIDGTQDILDRGMIDTQPTFVDNSIADDLKVLRERLEKLPRHPALKRLKFYIPQIEMGLTHVNELLMNCRLLKDKVGDEIFTIKAIENYILDELDETSDPASLEAFKQSLSELAKTSNVQYLDRKEQQLFAESMAHHRLYQSYVQIVQWYTLNTNESEYQEYEELIRTAQRFIEDSNVKIKKPSKGREYYFKGEQSQLTYLAQLLAFLVVLTEVDRFNKLILTEVDQLRSLNLVKLDDLYSLNYSNIKASNFTFEPLISTQQGYRVTLNEGYHSFDLRRFSYVGVGRQLIPALTQIKSPLNQQGPAVLALSGTSFFPDSPSFHFEEEPSILLESIDEHGELIPEGHIESRYFPATAGSCPKLQEYVGVSGSGQGESRQQALLRVIKDCQAARLLKKQEGEKPSLIVVGNYTEAEWLSQQLNSLGVPSLALAKEDKKTGHLITKSLVEDLAQIPEHQDKQALVVSLHSITRGYNILDHEFNSYFGSVFMCVRPYPQPHAFENAIKFAHYKRSQTLAAIKKDPALTAEGFFNFLKAVEQFKDKNYKNYLSSYNMGTWDELKDDQRMYVASDAFSPIKQMIGRTQRNRNATKVYYLDGAFCRFGQRRYLGTEQGTSMFDYWLRALRKLTNESYAAKALYGEFLRSLEEMIEEFKKENRIEE